MTRIPRNISYPFLALFLFSFLVAHSYELIKSLQIPCPLSLEFSSRLIPQGTNLTITPGHTEKLNISLKGYDEDIIFEFLSDKTGPSIFKVSTIVNGQTESVSFANFFEPETFTVFVDQQTKACFIAGDKGFSLTQPLAENDYHMVVNQDIPPEMADISSLVLHNGLENATLIVFSTLGGTFTIFAMIYVASFKRANTLSNELPIKSVESITLKERLMTKVADKLERFRCKNRKTVIEQKFEQKTHTHKDDPTKTEHDNAEDFHQYYQAHTRQKIIFPENNEEDHGAGLALDMDFEDDEGRRMPTIADIKALIRDMEDKGELNCEYDPSEDTDEEDQYEAPMLPNYFCCMLCFEGKRCTVAEPCRHVFACEGCVKELVESKQTCVLCAKNITSYEPL